MVFLKLVKNIFGLNSSTKKKTQILHYRKNINFKNTKAMLPGVRTPPRAFLSINTALTQQFHEDPWSLHSRCPLAQLNCSIKSWRHTMNPTIKGHQVLTVTKHYFDHQHCT
jgi:hypothetical protein